MKNLLKYVILALTFQISQVMALPFSKRETNARICQGYSWELFVEMYQEYLSLLNNYLDTRLNHNYNLLDFNKLSHQAIDNLLLKVGRLKNKVEKIEELRKELEVVFEYIKEDLKSDKDKSKIIELLINNELFNENYHKSLSDCYNALIAITMPNRLIQEDINSLTELEKTIINSKIASKIKELNYIYETLNKYTRKEIHLSFKTFEELYWNAKQLILDLKYISIHLQGQIRDIAKINPKLDYSVVIDFIESRLDSIFNEYKLRKQSNFTVIQFVGIVQYFDIKIAEPKEQPSFWQKLYNNKGKIAGAAAALATTYAVIKNKDQILNWMQTTGKDNAVKAYSTISDFTKKHWNENKEKALALWFANFKNVIKEADKVYKNHISSLHSVEDQNQIKTFDFSSSIMPREISMPSKEISAEFAPVTTQVVPEAPATSYQDYHWLL